jgi:hypothetical protein
MGQQQGQDLTYQYPSKIGKLEGWEVGRWEFSVLSSLPSFQQG